MWNMGPGGEGWGPAFPFGHPISTTDRTHARTGPDTQRAQAHNHTQNSNPRTQPRHTRSRSHAHTHPSRHTPSATPTRERTRQEKTLLMFSPGCDLRTARGLRRVVCCPVHRRAARVVFKIQAEARKQVRLGRRSGRRRRTREDGHRSPGRGSSRARAVSRTHSILRLESPAPRRGGRQNEQASYSPTSR